jgi:hypothetical protein
MANLQWTRREKLNSRSFICGYCGNPLASEDGYFATNSAGRVVSYIYICHKCEKPTFFDEDSKQTPGVIFGKDVLDIDDESIKNLYNEARKCTSNNSFTAAVLCCRKLLMHIAVAKGAEQNKNFIEYVEFLSEKNYIPPDAKEWVDHIRTKGNEANHEIKIMVREDAQDLLSFIEMLLKIIYEFPANIKKKIS